MSRLMRTGMYAGIGLLIGLVAAAVLSGLPSGLVIVAFAGFPAGWSFIGRYFGHTFVFGSIVLVMAWMAIKVVLCLFIGWIVLIVEIIRGIMEASENRTTCE